jgi:glycosyltransferase involved in cell wall biosynthesis
MEMTNMLPLLSVIIPTYNREQFLAAALESVLNQDFENYEVIVVDDGSTDDTPALLSREMTRDRWAGRLRVLRQSNGGPGRARNLALQQARGEYCAFLDSDDLFFPWSLSVIAKAIDIGGRPSILIGSELQFKTIDQHAGVAREPLKISRWKDLYTYGNTGPTGRLIARTKAVNAAGGFMAERIVGEDSDLMLRLGTLPGLVKIESPHTYGYRMHSQNFSGCHKRWVAGALTMIRRYRDGVFPGGPERKAEVRQIVASHVNFYTLFCIETGARWEATKLYLKTFGWFAREGYFNHLLVTPLHIALHLVRPWVRRAKRWRNWKAAIARRCGLKAACEHPR